MMKFFQQRPAWARHLIIIVVLALLGLSLGVLVNVKGKRQTATTDTAIGTTSSQATDTLDLPDGQVKASPTAASTAAATTTKSGGFRWGVTLRPELYNDAEANVKLLPDQFASLKELGVNMVRVDYNTKNDSLNRLVLDLAKQHNMEVVFIIPFGPNDIYTDKNLKTNAYNYVAAIVKKYKGEIKVWQLGTEIASVALIDGGHHGVDKVDYPEAKYRPVANWLLSATKAVKDSDPNAKRLLNDQWVHVGFFDKFIADGGDFDILGWNWFSDMGTSMEKPVLDAKTKQTYKLMDKLKSYKKEIWLTEINRRNGDSDGNSDAQAEFIATLANYAAKNSAINGFIVFHFIGEQGYGISRINYDTHTLSTPKPAFNTYQQLIKKYR